jgi:hypothetical protein
VSGFFRACAVHVAMFIWLLYSLSVLYTTRVHGLAFDLCYS